MEAVLNDVSGPAAPPGPFNLERLENLALLEAMYGEFSNTRLAHQLAEQVRLDVEGVDWTLPMPKVWRVLLDRAHRSDLLPALLRAVLIDHERAAAHAALELYLGVPGHPEEEAVVELLGAQFWRANAARLVVSFAGLQLADINWAQPMVRVWAEAVRLARTAGLLHTLLHTALDQLEPTSESYTALLDQLDLLGWSERELEDLASLFASWYHEDRTAHRIMVYAGLDVADVYWGQPMRRVWSDIVHLARRRALLHSLARVIEGDGVVSVKNHRHYRELLGVTRGARPRSLEKIVNRSSLVPMPFLTFGAKCGAAVVRIRIDGKGMGTGFLIAPDLVLTARLILISSAGEPPATSVEIDFGYEETDVGEIALADTFRGRIDTIASGLVGPDGWAVIRTNGNPGSKYPPLKLEPQIPSIGDRVSVIQHPGGGLKRIALLDGMVRSVDDQMISYTSETLPGSTGAPVFDEGWRVVAIHVLAHLIDLPDGAGKELRRSGLRIEPVLRDLKTAGLL
jgi:endonuclease G